MRLPRLLARLRRDERGLALIEFAFAVPVLATLFVGGYQVMDAVSAYRKVTTTDRALADLTTQSTSLTANQVQQIMAAAQQIMAPYPKAQAGIRISHIKIDASLKATIDWSEANNGTDYAKGTDVSLTVPSGMKVGNTYLVYAEMNYSYVPNIASGMFGTIPLRDTIYMSPRNSTSIPCADC